MIGGPGAVEGGYRLVRGPLSQAIWTGRVITKRHSGDKKYVSTIDQAQELEDRGFEM